MSRKVSTEVGHLLSLLFKKLIKKQRKMRKQRSKKYRIAKPGWEPKGTFSENSGSGPIDRHSTSYDLSSSENEDLKDL